MAELLLERRGCMFSENDDIRLYSDVGNYRVYTEFIDCENRTLYGDFDGHFWNPKQRKRYKKPCPVPMYGNFCTMDTEGNCWGVMLDCKGRPYTIAAILETVNEYAYDRYDSVKWVERVTFELPVGKPFDIREKILQNFHGCEKVEGEGMLLIRCYTGVWKYWTYISEPRTYKVLGETKEYRRYTILMEEAEDRDYFWTKVK